MLLYSMMNLNTVSLEFSEVLLETSGCPWPKATVKSPVGAPALPPTPLPRPALSGRPFSVRTGSRFWNPTVQAGSRFRNPTVRAGFVASIKTRNRRRTHRQTHRRRTHKQTHTHVVIIYRIAAFRIF
jgi:hypothetical protein